MFPPENCQRVGRSQNILQPIKYGVKIVGRDYTVNPQLIVANPLFPNQNCFYGTMDNFLGTALTKQNARSGRLFLMIPQPDNETNLFMGIFIPRVKDHRQGVKANILPRHSSGRLPQPGHGPLVDHSVKSARSL
jgi:hypothetical protein